MNDEDQVEELRRRMALEDAQPNASPDGLFAHGATAPMNQYTPFPIFHPQAGHTTQASPAPAYAHVQQMVPIQASQVSCWKPWHKLDTDGMIVKGRIC